MSVRNPKTRLISFRLSESDYRALQSLCDAREERSLSDFVRSTVQWMAYNGEPSHANHFGLPPPEDPLMAGAANRTFPRESGSNGWEPKIARDLLELTRKAAALDREIRRLSLLLTRP